MAFYPGANPDPERLEPHIHYALEPAVALEPVSSTYREIVYKEVNTEGNVEAEFAADYLTRNHPGFRPSSFHQATPLYRLTLCERGCEATEDNTVFLTLAHIVLRSYNQYNRLECICL